MTNIKKLSYFIILFAMSNMVQGGNYNKASLELNGIEDGKTYSSPIKIDFIVKNMKVVKAGVNEKNSGTPSLIIEFRRDAKFKNASSNDRKYFALW
jgi:hypothetical protein